MSCLPEKCRMTRCLFTPFLVGFKTGCPMFNTLIHFTFCFVEDINNCICKPFTCKKFAFINLTIRYKIGAPCCSVRKAVLYEIIIRVWLGFNFSCNLKRMCTGQFLVFRSGKVPTLNFWKSAPVPLGQFF